MSDDTLANTAIHAPASDPIDARLVAAVEFAREAGGVTLEYFRTPQLAVERKGDDSPVTVADQRAEQHLRERIGERFPGDAILGEEFGHTAGDSGFTWVLDPIDGTKSFIHGIPLYTTLVAVLATPDGELASGKPQIGVIRVPALDEEIYARTGGGCWHRRGTGPATRAQVATKQQLSEGLLLTSEVATFETGRTPSALEVFVELQRTARLARTWGDAYGYLMVASGQADVMIDPAMSVWDAAALQPVIEEAGGRFADWRGEATVHSGDALAGNPTLVEEVLGYTRKFLLAD